MKAIVILGAAVWADGASPTLRRRALHGATLWHNGAAQFIVACGGVGLHPPTEAAAIRDILIDTGVPKSAILIEDQSTTTLENLRFAVPILAAHGCRSVTIVTDITHGPRANLDWRHLRSNQSDGRPV